MEMEIGMQRCISIYTDIVSYRGLLANIRNWYSQTAAELLWIDSSGGMASIVEVYTAAVLFDSCL